MAIDRNVRTRAYAFFRCYNAFHKRKGQHKGPLTRGCRDVMKALLWLSGRRSSICYVSIAAEAQCSIDTVWKALRRLRAAGLITWTNRWDRVTRKRTTNYFRWQWPQMPGNIIETGNRKEDLTKGFKQEEVAKTVIRDRELDRCNAAIERLLALKPRSA